MFELQYMLDGDKKIFMTITLNFYIVINKSYLYNYSEKDYSMIDNELENKKSLDKIYQNNILYNENKQQIKILKN